MSTERDNKLALFEGRQIRKTFHEGEWWFSIIDVVEALVGGDRPRKYWSDLKKELAAEGYSEVSGKIGQLKMIKEDPAVVAAAGEDARDATPDVRARGRETPGRSNRKGAV